ncbi:MAG: restriction endonuclease subunit S, partial [Bacteroidales bacterium]
MMEKQKNIPKLRFTEFFRVWDKKKLGEVGKFIGGGTPSTQNNDFWNGSIPWISSSDLIDDNIYQINKTRFVTNEAVLKSAAKIVPKHSVIIVSRVGVGKVAVNEENLCTSQDFTNLIVNTDNYKFLAYLIKYKTNKLLEFNQGTSIKGFVKSDLENLELLFPTLPEQQKIASFLTAVDDKLTHLKQKKSLLEQYKKGIMQKLFSQEIRFKDDNGKNYNDWEKRKLGKIGTFFSGGTPLTTKSQYFKGEIPFIRSGEINSDKTLQYITELGLKNSSAKMVEVGDLIYALYGATSGEVAISKIKGAINQAILCIRTNEVNEFLYYYLLFNKEIIIKTYLQGGQGNLSADIIKSITIPIPSIEEQTKIANFLSAIDDKISH